MRVLVPVFLTFLVSANSQIIDNFNYLEESLNHAKQTPERFYETLPLSIREDGHLLAPELIQKYGYPCERHPVITKDGYILELHRISYGKQGPSNDRPAVFVQHGLISSSADWVITGPGKSLPHLLVDSGYDVWLGNSRGNRYSRNHTTFDPDNNGTEFWDFSWHDMAIYDLPATVDYVRNVTNQEKIFYIGHSQGTTVAYALLSKLPEYNRAFRAVFSLAPVAYMGNFYSPKLKRLSKYERSLNLFAKAVGWYEYLPRSELRARLAPIFCHEKSIFVNVCWKSLFGSVGFNVERMNSTLLPVIMGHTPAGAATKQMLHYAQSINSGKFREWDYGVLGNLEHYRRFSPPRYNLENIDVPHYVFYSDNDWLSNSTDAERLVGELKNVHGTFLIKNFTHIDYVIALDAPDLIFKPIINFMDRH